ncbi:organic cation transporter protein-like isoform X2 [Tubulanus polymorphus]
MERSQCKMYTNYSSETNVTESCTDGWTYDSTIGSTIVTEWNLVCDRNYFVETSQSLFVAGVLLGALVFPALSDRVGRKPVHFGCQWAMVVVGTIIAVVPNFEAFAALKFFNGALREGSGLTGIVLCCELWQASHRSVAGISIQLFWSAAWFILALMAYCIRDWRHLQLAISLPCILTIAVYWYVPESLIWLVANGRAEEARKHFRKAAITENNDNFEQYLHEADELNAVDEITADRALVSNHDSDSYNLHSNHLSGSRASSNSSTVKKNLLNCFRKGSNQRKDEEGRKYTFLDVLRSKRMLINASIMCSLWFVNTLVYHGLTLLSTQLAGNIYLNFFLSGIVEIPAYILCIICLQKLGRRWPLVVHHIITGVALLLASVIPKKTDSGTDLSVLITVLALIAKYAITFSFAEIVLYAQEIYPTNLRNSGLGVSSLFGRIANILAPFSTYVVKYLPWFPGVLFGALSIFVGFAALILPETLNRPLPQTIEDIENWHRSPVDDSTNVENDELSM